MENQKIAAIFGLLLLGFFLKKFPFKEETKEKIPLILNKVIIYLCLPSLILKVMPNLGFEEESWFYPLSHWFILFILTTLTYTISKALKLERKTVGCLLILVPLGNTSFFGYPMVEIFYGEGALPYAILYDQIGSFLGLALYAPFILSIYGGEKIPSFTTFLKKLGGFPPLIALIISFSFIEVLLNETIQTVITPLSKGVIPLAMIAVGFQFRKPSPELGLPLTLGLFFKMAISPLIALLFFKIFGTFDQPEKVVIFQSAMPPMITAAILASEKGLNKDLSISLTGIGLLLAFILLPLYFGFLKLI